MLSKMGDVLEQNNKLEGQKIAKSDDDDGDFETRACRRTFTGLIEFIYSSRGNLHFDLLRPFNKRTNKKRATPIQNANAKLINTVKMYSIKGILVLGHLFIYAEPYFEN